VRRPRAADGPFTQAERIESFFLRKGSPMSIYPQLAIFVFALLALAIPMVGMRIVARRLG
jgi:hypothetical protein